MAYLKKWRKCHAEVRALAQSSSSSGEQEESERDDPNIAAGDTLENADDDFDTYALSSDYDSDSDNEPESCEDNESDIGEDFAAW